jgi:hypothetical protein
MFIIGERFRPDAGDNLLENVTAEPQGVVISSNFIDEMAMRLSSSN